MEHTRFEEEHRNICDDCREAYLEYLQDQEIDDEMEDCA